MSEIQRRPDPTSPTPKIPDLVPRSYVAEPPLTPGSGRVAAVTAREIDPSLTLEVRDLRLVAAVVKEGALTRASSVLHLTPSALSHQLLGLEERLGVRLFERTPGRMRATPSGERLAKAAESILASLAEAESGARKATRSRAVLRISTECYTSYYWLPGVIRAFEKRHPDIEARIIAEATRDPLAQLLAGNLDVALVNSTARDRRVCFLPTFNDELVALVPRGHPWASRPRVTAEDFAAQHLIHYSMPRAHMSIFRDVLTPAGVEPRRVSQVPLTEAILEMVKGGLGVTVLARWAAHPYLEAGSLHAVRVGRDGLVRRWYAATVRSAATVSHLVNFVEALKEHGPVGSSRAPGRPASVVSLSRLKRR